MASVPWLAYLADDPARCEALENYVSTVEKVIDNPDVFTMLSGEYATQLPGLNDLGKAADLNGNLFLETALDNWRATPLNNKPASAGMNQDPDKEKRGTLKDGLRKLNEIYGEAQPFYALLLMDGDLLGNLLLEYKEHEDGQTKISDALARFTKYAPGIVRRQNGITVYAGGDDLLAMLPIKCALECTIKLRECYGAAFTDHGPVGDATLKEQATASCAIVFAHYTAPLREVLNLAHHALEDTAKEGNGRNSLALVRMLNGGVKQRWVGRFGTLPKALLSLYHRIWDEEYSASFFYRLQKSYAAILHNGDTDDFHIFNADDLHAVMLAEYLKDGADHKCAECAVKDLLAACRTQRGDKPAVNDSLFQFGGMFIARFLAETSRYGPMEQSR